MARGFHICFLPNVSPRPIHKYLLDNLSNEPNTKCFICIMSFNPHYHSSWQESEPHYIGVDTEAQRQVTRWPRFLSWGDLNGKSPSPPLSAFLHPSCPHPHMQCLSSFFFFFFFLFRATPEAYGSSQARGGIGAAAASLCCSHSNTRSELHL